MGRGGRRPRKKRDIQKEDEVQINKLPDEIMISIMCLLSVEEGARANVVCWRWNKLWKKAIVGTPRLNFYVTNRVQCSIRWPYKTTSESHMNEYVNRVNKVLKLHRGASNSMEEFIIGFPLNSFSTEHINKWVEFAATKGVKKLKLDFCIRWETVSSRRSRSYDWDFLASPGAVRFYRLRDLYLRGVNVGEEVIHCFFSNSPFIERLSVINSQKLHKLELGAAPNLRYLDIRYCKSLRYLKIHAPNLNVMKLHAAADVRAAAHPSLIRVNIYAPKLSQATVFLFQRLPAPILIDMSDCFQELLGQFSHVNKRLSLKLIPKVITALAKTNVLPRHPELSNVEHLKIAICFNLNEAGMLSRFEGLLWPSSLLEATPCLHKFSIKLFHLELKLTDTDIDFKWMDEDIPKKVKANVGRHYSHQNLKVVEFFNFTGTRYEIELLLHLMEIAASLEKLVIHVFDPTSNCLEEDILSHRRNQYDKVCQCCAELRKTHIRPEIDVLVI